MIKVFTVLEVRQHGHTHLNSDMAICEAYSEGEAGQARDGGDIEGEPREGGYRSEEGTSKTAEEAA